MRALATFSGVSGIGSGSSFSTGPPRLCFGRRRGDAARGFDHKQAPVPDATLTRQEEIIAFSTRSANRNPFPLYGPTPPCA